MPIFSRPISHSKMNCLNNSTYFRSQKKIKVFATFAVKFAFQIHQLWEGLPAIATKEGTRYRTESIQSHIGSKYHEQCKRADCLNNMQLDQNKASMDYHISRANKQLADRIAKLILQVYTDGKKLINSAYSWQARYVSAEASHHFDFDKKSDPTIPKKIEMQYPMNPNSHSELLSASVKSHEELEEKFNFSIGRFDSGWRLTDGKNELNFFGIGKQTGRGAIGLMNAIRNGIKSNVGEKWYKMIILKITSICTEGTNINSGERRDFRSYLKMRCAEKFQRYHYWKFGALHIVWIWCWVMYRNHIK